MLKRISIFPVFLLAFVALAAGCGSGDDGITKAEFIKQAEAICIKADRAESGKYGEYFQQNAERLKNEPPPPKNVRTIREVVRTIHVPATMKEIEELEALELPADDEEELKEIFTGTKEGLEKLHEEPQLVWASRANNPLYPTFRAARKYGFLSCAEA